MRMLCRVVGLFFLVCVASAQPGVRGIARIADPPPPVDGSLERLETAGTAFVWEKAEQVIYGRSNWSGAKDLSGTVYLGWDRNQLYVAATVVDDMVTQPYFGRNVFKGDHLEVFLDVPRHDVSSRNGLKVYQIGLSPGNFLQGEANVPPEVVVWSPLEGTVEGARVAAVRTADGYRIEAALPWKALGVEKVEENLGLGIDVTLSDADELLDSGQESMCSLLTEAWTLRDPNRMLEVALGDSNGKIDLRQLKASFNPVAEDLRVLPGGQIEVDLGSVDKEIVRELVVRARIDHTKPAGGTQCLEVELNGTRLGMERVRNRLRRFDMSGKLISSYSHRGWFLFYVPDYTPLPSSSSYSVRDIHPCELRFDVTGLWKPDGGNSLVLQHHRPEVKRAIVAAVAVEKKLSGKLLPPKPKVAPTGPLSCFEPGGKAGPSYSATPRKDGALEIAVGKRKWMVQSQFSTIEPAWIRLVDGGLTADAAEYRVRRTVTRYPDHVHVLDRVTNTSDEDQPVMVRHAVDAGEGVREIRIAGLKVAGKRYRISQGAHPASLALTATDGIALLSEDDIMRAQAMNCRNGNVISIDNNRLVVARGSSVDLEFSIYPLETPDPFLFVNRVRRNWNTNFTLDGSFAFIKQRRPVSAMSDEQFKAYLTGKTAKFICSSMGYYKGTWAHGSAFKHTDPSIENILFKRARRLYPGLKTFFYFHCYISVHEDDPVVYAADALRRPDGSQANYRDDKYPIFIPRAGSPFAKLQEELIDMRFDKLDLDGIYWDEIAYSAYTYDYGDRWDGYSAIIDPQTHRITRKIAHVTLATLPWRLKMAKSLMVRGLLIGNGVPLTRSFTQLHFPRFMETASITNLTRGQLYTPIALGDHLTERTPLDCYRNMLDALDYGAVYYWYSGQVVARKPTFTSVMFPITPMELGPGYLIGKERILTNRSGLFGWGDDSDFEAVVFDDKGARTDNIKVRKILKEGKRYGEVRIPDGYGVALVRR